MERPAHTEEKNGLKIEIWFDTYADSPANDQDPGVFLTGYHREFWVEAPKQNGQIIYDQEDVLSLLSGETKTSRYWVFPLEAYIHSGVSLALGSEGNFPDRKWDVSTVGAVFIAKNEAKTRAAARKMAWSLIAYWNDFLSGNVFGYKIKTQSGEELEAVWGFAGDYDAPGGCLDEARRSTAYHAADIKEACANLLN